MEREECVRIGSGKNSMPPPSPVVEPVLAPVRRSGRSTAPSERLAVAGGITRLSAVEKAVADSKAAGARLRDFRNQARSSSRGRVLH